MIEKQAHPYSTTKAVMSSEELLSLFKKYNTNVVEFLYWAEEEAGCKISRYIVTEHRAGRKPITSPWALTYASFFFGKERNVKRMKKFSDYWNLVNRR